MAGSSDETADQSLDRLRRQVALCDEFESALRRGELPSVEEFVARLPVAEHAELREILLALELTFAQNRRSSTAPGTGTGTGTAPDFELETTSRQPRGDGRAAPPGGPLAPGSKLDRYEVLEEIGRGGMAVVYRGFDPVASRHVAIKVLLSNPRAREESVHRFQREQQANGRLDHPDVATIFDAGEARGLHYIVMQYLAGGSLAGRVHVAPMADRPAAELMARVARAVQHSHDRGVIHRDLKPSNILLDEAGKPYLCDFGLVRFLGTDPDPTQTGPLLGTIPYMSPEQTRAPDAVVAATDIYSLGATLYCVLVGRPPFRAADPIETLRQIRDEPPPPPRKQNPAISRDLETLCLKCLEKSPERRFATAEELAQELDRVVRREPILTRPPALPERLARAAARRPWAAASIGGLALLGVACFALVTMLWLQSERRRRELTVDGYFDRIALAAQAVGAQRFDRASTHLDGIPGPLRGWAWRVLRRLTVGPSTIFRGEKTALSGVEFAPDSSAFVTVCDRGQARIWDLGSGRASPPLGGLPADVVLQDVAWPAAGEAGWIAAAGRDGMVYLWERRGGGWSPRALPKVHKARVNRLAVDAKGRRLLSCGDDGLVVLWDAAQWTPSTLLDDGQNHRALAISPDGRQFAASGNKQTLIVGRCDGGGPRSSAS